MGVFYEWTVTPEYAFGELTDAYVASIRRGVRAIATNRAPEIEAWMKANHLWQNRTGAAEAGLYTEVEQLSQDMATIILSHGVEYGLWLEIAHAGQYSIIGPAIDHFAPIIWNDVQQMFR